MIKKLILSVVTAAFVITAGNVNGVYAQDEEEVGHTGYIGNEDIQVEEQDYDGEAILSEGYGNLPAKYRTDKLPGVRDQGSLNTCWAICTETLLEINQMQKDGEERDLSEYHLAYFSYNIAEEPMEGFSGDDIRFTEGNWYILSHGGNYSLALNALSSWRGAVNEEFLRDNGYKIGEILNIGIEDELAYCGDVRLKEYRVLDMADSARIKKAIMEYGAVAGSYYSDSSKKDSRYYKAANAAYYCDKDIAENHAIVIVGWDDYFSSDNFVEKPAGDGAWIVRNSWGDSFGEQGYFYISYYDYSIARNAYAAESFLAEEYDNNYQYDGAVYSNNVSIGTKGQRVEAANIFTASANAAGGEYISMVTFTTSSRNCSYSVEIYIMDAYDDEPNQGMLAARESGITEAQGMYCVELSKDVFVPEGTRFSVVVTLENESGTASLCAERSAGGNGFDSTASAQSGQSFIYNSNKGKWIDYGAAYDANIRIKAFTRNNYASSQSEIICIDGELVYVENGNINYNYSGLVFYDDDWWCVSGGRVASGYSGLWYDEELGWWYVENGVVNHEMDGLVFFNESWWYVSEGRLISEYSGQVPDKEQTGNVLEFQDLSVFILENTREHIVAGIVAGISEQIDIEYRWSAEDSSGNTRVIQDWTLNYEWLDWVPETFGEYNLIGEARIAGNPASLKKVEEIVCYNPYIKGKCQLPCYMVSPGQPGYYIGIETYENPNQSYQYEMLILDCTLLAEGQPAWVYTTGRFNVTEGAAGWCIWQPLYGYYWTLFRVYDDKGNMIDQACYPFANVY